MGDRHFQHPVVTDELFIRAIDGIPSRMHGMHGLPHWQMVERNGLILAEKEGGDARVVSLFALLHDSRRINDDADPEHGLRAAVLAKQLHAEGLLPLDETQLSQLVYACEHHTDETHTQDVTIGCCWDADRLDLIRCGIEPDPEYLNTATAKEIAGGDFQRLIRQVPVEWESPLATPAEDLETNTADGRKSIARRCGHGVLRFVTLASFLLSLLLCAIALVMFDNFNLARNWHGLVLGDVRRPGAGVDRSLDLEMASLSRHVDPPVAALRRTARRMVGVGAGRRPGFNPLIGFLKP